MFLLNVSASPFESSAMPFKLELNEISNPIQNSSSVGDCNDQYLHPKVATLEGQNATGSSPIMHPRIQRPLSTYTCLGSPIHRTTGIFAAPRKMSLGNDNASSSPTLQSRSRSNSQSTVVPGLPSLFLPLPQSLHDDLVYVPPTVDGNVRRSVKALNELSDNLNIVIETTLAAEQKRALELEQEEASMTSDQLRQVLKRERDRAAKIQADRQVALLRYNDLLSHNHQQHYNRPTGELSDSDQRIQQGLLTRRKRKLETE